MKLNWMGLVGLCFLYSEMVVLAAPPPELSGRATRGIGGVRWVTNPRLNQNLSTQVVNGVLKSTPKSFTKQSEVDSFKNRLTSRLPLGAPSQYSQGAGKKNKHNQYTTYGIKFYSWWYLTAGWVPWKLLRN